MNKPRFCNVTSGFCHLALGCLWLFVSGTGSTAKAANDDWVTSVPEEVGLDSTALVEMCDYALERRIPVHSVQIVRRGKLVLDAYFYPFAPGLRHDVASVTKSITSTLVGLAMEKELLPGAKAKLRELVPDRKTSEWETRKQNIRLEDLLTMRAGWDCGFEPNEARLFEMRKSADWFQFMLNVPMVADPGTRWAYCSGNCHVLSVLITRATGTNALGFARRELFAPLGISDVAWPSDAGGNNHGWGDLQLRPRDMAKIGYLFLRGGQWNDRRIVSKEWIREATRAHVDRTSNNDGYGYFWWVKVKDYPGMFEAVGRGGQRINIWPAKDLVLVFTGGGFEPGDLARFILKALKSDTPLPSNPNGLSELNNRLAVAQKAPPRQPVPRMPTLAAEISGKTFELATNALNISSLTLTFNNSSEASFRLKWNGQDVAFSIGLNAVERFSTNPLVGLPQAAKGAWLDDKSFLLELDLVGGVNFYHIRLTFSEGKVDVAVSERTGLNPETFSGFVR